VNVLVTGGAGFIGTNLVSRLLAAGHTVTVYDNLSRPGAQQNAEWLRERHAATNRLRIIIDDVRHRGAMMSAARDADAIYHLAAQVAVTTSVADPMSDFDVNAFGTLNVLEVARRCDSHPLVVFTSTNKVYGAMDDIPVVEKSQRYEYADAAYGAGIDESRPLDFHSPYGCSKGSADQYVRDYHRIYGLRTTVFRMSCIYGPHQFGNEDQGWVAHFIIALLLGLNLTIYGDGKQVRDILYVDDLVRAFELVLTHPERTAGRVYNVGGGPTSTLSVWAEFGEILRELESAVAEPRHEDWRPGDQRVYVSNTARIQRDLGWAPRVSVRQGIERLHRWAVENHAQIDQAVGLVPA
jgi:CDP-paratose 2-epimerase